MSTSHLTLRDVLRRHVTLLGLGDTLRADLFVRSDPKALASMLYGLFVRLDTVQV
jgi:hypothetical protein